jgi:hypothetical protein
MPHAPPRLLTLPGFYSSNGPCVRCGGALPKAVRSGLSAYFCDEYWQRIEERASGLDPVFHAQGVFGRMEDD